jgi:hypothetical protein
LKYYCNYDNEYFCSNCLAEHTKTPHKVSQCLPRSILNNLEKSSEDEILLVKKHIEDKQLGLNTQNKSLSDMKHKLQESTKKQLEMLETEMNNIISMIKKHKEAMDEKVKSNYKSQIEQIDNFKKTINQNLSHLSQIMANILRMIQKLESITLLIRSE